MNTAIYLVVLEARQPGPQGLQVWDVVNAIPCFLETVEPLWDEHVRPLYNQGRHIQAMYIAREPYPNPFQEKAAGGGDVE